MTDLDVGLRERKKVELRHALVSTALELMAEHGFEHVSVEQIADRVGVSARTFHRYFPNKQDVLFADTAERSQRFAAALGGRPADEPVLQSLREATVELAEALGQEPATEAMRQRVIEADDSLRARSLRVNEEWVTLLADHCARRLGLARDDTLPRLLGACTTGALRTARVRWLAAPRRRDLATELRACFDLLHHLEAAVEEAAER